MVKILVGNLLIRGSLSRKKFWRRQFRSAMITCMIERVSWRKLEQGVVICTVEIFMQIDWNSGGRFCMVGLLMEELWISSGHAVTDSSVSIEMKTRSLSILVEVFWIRCQPNK